LLIVRRRPMSVHRKTNSSLQRRRVQHTSERVQRMLARLKKCEQECENCSCCEEHECVCLEGFEDLNGAGTRLHCDTTPTPPPPDPPSEIALINGASSTNATGSSATELAKFPGWTRDSPLLYRKRALEMQKTSTTCTEMMTSVVVAAQKTCSSSSKGRESALLIS
jgi:hypothetical protein